MTYEEVVKASFPNAAWALAEAAGTDFAPYTRFQHLTSTGVDAYQQAGPCPPSFSVHVNPGKLLSPVSLPFLRYFCMEGWFNPDGLTGAGTRILMWLGDNSAADGWGAYLPAGSNRLHILAAPSGPDLDTLFDLPVGAFTLVQIANLSGTTGEIDVAVNGEVIGQIVTGGSGNPVGYGFGGESSRASNFVGKIAWPAVYTQQQTMLSLRSRFIGCSDPVAGNLISLSGCCASSSSDLAEILAAVRHTYT